MKVLILGVAGGIARLLAQRLLSEGHQVIGIDVRPWWDAPAGLELHRTDVRKRAAEEVFRHHRPEAVVHMATMTALTVRGSERERINLDGTRAVFEHCAAYGVKQLLFVGRHTFYGAAADSALYHKEEEAPRALGSLPELADLVAADLYAANALWRLPQLTTAVLRVCYTLGTPGSGTLAGFLRGRRVPLVLGYDPLFQVIHEEDLVTALMLALDKRLRGIFNVAGPPPVPLSIIVRQTGRTPVPLPGAVLKRLLGRAGFPRLSAGALDHLRYPVIVDASRFKEATGFQPAYDEGRILRTFLEACPPPRRSGG